MGERPALGHGLRRVLEALAEEIRKRTSLVCEWNPTLISLRDPAVVLTPETLEFELEGEARVEGIWRYTAALTLKATLTGEGPRGPEFLAEMMEASFRVGLLFLEPWSFPLGGGIEATFAASRTAKGRFFALEEEGEGPFLYEEVWDGKLLFPVTVSREAGRLSLVAPGWPIEIKTGGA